MIIELFSQFFNEKMAFLTQSKAKLCKILIMTSVFEQNAYFCQKLSKIAENRDHNIGIWSPCQTFESHRRKRIRPICCFVMTVAHFSPSHSGKIFHEAEKYFSSGAE
jgi:hypothetical protein